MSPAVRGQVEAELKSALDAFVEQHGPQWSAWRAKVEPALCAQLQQPMFDDGVVFTNDSKPHEPGTRFEPFLDSYREDIKRLHRDFVVTVADKVSNNLVVVCKKFYIQKLCEDLASTDFYAPVQQADGTSAGDTVIHSLLQKLRGEFRDIRKNMYGHCGSSVAKLRDELKVVPYAAALVKLHKTPTALRFLACSGANGLKLPAQWLTALLRSLRSDLVKMWEGQFAPLDLNAVKCPPWFATRSAEVVDAAHKFNLSNTSARKFVAGGGWKGYDVVRLYTNINTRDLIAKLCTVMGWAWQRHADGSQPCTCVQVFWDASEGCSWWKDVGTAARFYGTYSAGRKAGMKTPRLGVDSEKGKFYLFDLAHAEQVVQLLVENYYVRFGTSYYHQVCGIPMGINPAVFMANYYVYG
jgi:hypothetical protein